MGELLPVHGIADVPDEYAFFVGPVRISAPVGLLSLQRCHHDVVVEFHLNRIRVVRSFDKLQIFRIPRISHIQYRPTAMPLVSHVEIPAPRYLANRHLERSATAIKAAVTDCLHVARLPAFRNRISVTRGTRQQYEDRQWCEKTENQTLNRLSYRVVHFMPPIDHTENLSKVFICHTAVCTVNDSVPGSRQRFSLGFGQLSRLRAGGLPKAGDDIPRLLE